MNIFASAAVAAVLGMSAAALYWFTAANMLVAVSLLFGVTIWLGSKTRIFRSNDDTEPSKVEDRGPIRNGLLQLGVSAIVAFVGFFVFMKALEFLRPDI